MSDTVASASQSHTFYTEGAWWQRCARCGLGEAAHRSTLEARHGDAALALLEYRCPACVTARDFGHDLPHDTCPREVVPA